MQESYNDINFRNIHQLSAIWEKNTLNYLQNRLFGAKFEDRTSKYVTIFGATQCGKTTLILTLIGIKDEYIFELSKILRGSRSFGKSSTSTAVIYTRSNDDSFGLVELEKDEQFADQHEFDDTRIKCLDVEEFKSRIDAYRNRMTAGDSLPLAVKYYIPQRFFEQADGNNNLVIIDLPGTEANGVENGFAKSVADKYRMLSDANIVVISANEVQKLYDSGNEYRNHISDYGDICYFVTTKSITTFSANDRELAFPDGVFSGDAIKTYYKNVEVDKVRGRKLKDVVNPDRIFPVEIGETKNNFVANNGANRDVILSYIDGEISQLRQKILNSNSSSIFKYKNELKTHMNKLQDEIKGYNGTINVLGKECGIVLNQLEDISRGYNEAQKNISSKKDEMETIIQEIRKVNQYINGLSALKDYQVEGEFNKKTIPDIENKYKDFLNTYSKKIKNKLEKRILNINKTASEKLKPDDFAFLNNSISASASDFNYKECKTKDVGFRYGEWDWWKRKHYSKGILEYNLSKRLENDTEVFLKTIKEYYRENLDELKEKYRQAYEESISDDYAIIKSRENIVNDLKEKANTKTANLNKEKTKLTGIQKRYDSYLQFYNNFYTLVKNFYDIEITKINEAINSDSVSSGQKFLLLLTANHMEKVFNNKVKE